MWCESGKDLATFIMLPPFRSWMWPQTPSQASASAKVHIEAEEDGSPFGAGEQRWILRLFCNNRQVGNWANSFFGKGLRQRLSKQSTCTAPELPLPAPPLRNRKRLTVLIQSTPRQRHMQPPPREAALLTQKLQFPLLISELSC